MKFNKEVYFMKIATPFILMLIIFVFLLSGCGAGESYQEANVINDATDVSADGGDNSNEDLLSGIESDVTAAISGNIPYYIVTVTQSQDYFDVSIILLPEADIAYFGQYIVTGIQACEEVIKDNNTLLTMTLIDNNEAPYMLFHSSSTGYGYIADYRSGGDPVITIYDTTNDLAVDFPQLSSFLSKSELDEDDVAIYDAVWDVLNSQYWRSEDDVYEELAPTYGMNAQELKQFMMDMTMKVY